MVERNAPYLNHLVARIPDYPKPGIMFYDFCPLYENARAFGDITEHLVDRYKHWDIDKVVGIESRGFIHGAALADRIGAGFVLVRKPGKLPRETISASYELEYGTDSLEVHTDAIKAGEKVIIYDDLIATGGTASATGELVRKLGGDIHEFVFLAELVHLGGRENLTGNVYSVLEFDGT